MEDFCNGPFWNTSLTWYTDNPDLTQCFRDTVLPGVPCGLLWLSIPIWYHWTSNYHSKLKVKKSNPDKSAEVKDRLTFLFVAKLVVQLLLVVNLCGELALRMVNLSDLKGSDVFFPCCTFLTIVLATIILIYEKSKLLRTSPSLSLFWPVLFLTSIPTAKVEVERLLQEEAYGSSSTRILLTATYMPMILLLFLFNIYADKNDLEWKKDDHTKACPEQLNSFISTVYVSWMDPLIWQGFRKPLSPTDLPPLPDKVNVDQTVKGFQKHWKDQIAKSKVNFSNRARNDDDKNIVSMWLPLLKTFGLRFLWATSIAIFHYTIAFVPPQILKLLINHIEDTDDYAWKGYFFASLLLLVNFTSTTLFNNYLIHMYTVAIKIRSAVISTIVRKSLRLSNSARKKFTTGQITNLVSVDAQRLMDTFPFLAILWAAPYQTFLGMFFLYQELGPSALAGVAVLATLMPINIIGSKIGEILQRKQMTAKDSRIKLMNEILAGIKVLKMYAWEIPFMKRILGTRLQEVNVIKKTGILTAMNNFTYACSPILITIGSFSAYALSDPSHILTPQKVFVSMALFNLIRIPLTIFPTCLREVIKSYVSMKRIVEFLNADELDPNCVEDTVKDPKNAVELDHADLAWDYDGGDRIILSDISLTVPKGSLTAIVGMVGSGKSSMLSAILGEMERANEGSVRVSGSIAYVSQQAWIQNLTLRDNILFGKPFVSKKYKNVIDTCALKADLDILMHGDATEIGENGINLSGGQKQRVNLARAVYADQDIYLLDDPLSAVDAHVGKHIFDKVISNDNGALKNKTRIWVTNSVRYLPNVDHIVVMKNGLVCEQGSYGQLMAKRSAFSELLNKIIGTEDSSSESSTGTDTDSNPDIEQDDHHHDDDKYLEDQDDGRLVKDETAETGSVKLNVYLQYLRSIGFLFTAVFVSMVGLQQGLHVGGNIWLAHWSDKNYELDNNSTKAEDQPVDNDASYYLAIYATIGMLEVVFKLGNDLCYYRRCARASKVVHKNLLNNVMRSPMSFFDTNPTGRIVNRFTTDLDTVDQLIPFELLDFTWCLLETLATMVLISATTPVFIAVIIPLFCIYLFVQRIYITTSRQLKRLYSISKSPIFSHFTETVNGVSTVRAYNQDKRFIQQSQDTVGVNVQSVYPSLMSNRWLGTRLENIGNCITFFAALFAVMAKDTISPGQAALSVTYSLQIIGAMVWVVRQACLLENDCVAVERIMEYTKTDREAAWEGQEVDSWPNQGQIVFENYQTRYRAGLDLVLKGVNMTVESKEKVGIVGRTGAGKSSLTLSLFRIIEAAGGRILIDGQDISKLGLHPLRSKLSIIPQDPVLFTGDLRFNLDPTGDHGDQELWQSLELAHLKNHVVANLPNGLDHEVSEGGSNFSVGQRQLICLARALLRKTKILVLDEATAAVDHETDELIQATLRQEFADCTVLTIAHRLNTIMDSDRVALFSEGQLQEMDTPKALLQNEGSAFRAMANDARVVL